MADQGVGGEGRVSRGGEEPEVLGGEKGRLEGAEEGEEGFEVEVEEGVGKGDVGRRHGYGAVVVVGG